MSDKGSDTPSDDAFFDFDDAPPDIALSTDELFSIIDTSEVRQMEKSHEETPIDYGKSTKPALQALEGSEKDFLGERIAVLTVDDLLEVYSTNKQESYLIDDTPTDIVEDYTPGGGDTSRNKLLDKFAESKTDDILSPDETDEEIDEDLVIYNGEETDKQGGGPHSADSIDDAGDRQQPPKAAPLPIDPGEVRDIKDILNYFDEMLDALPEEKIQQFVKSEYFNLYKKVMKEMNTK